MCMPTHIDPHRNTHIILVGTIINLQRNLKINPKMHMEAQKRIAKANFIKMNNSRSITNSISKDTTKL